MDMGYGHQRTADNLRQLAGQGEVVCANHYPGMPEKDRRTWEGLRRFYESVSAFKRVPLIGGLAFTVFDAFQKVPPFYPKKNLSRPSLSLLQLFSLLKQGWGRHLVEKLRENPLPLVSTFFTPAFMAEFFGYPGEIFCVVCDTDIARTWVSLNPAKSRIKYFAPTERVAERLGLYGVRPENVFLTGYPLPAANVGGQDLAILKKDLRNRLLNLDPGRRFYRKYQPLIRKHLGDLPSDSGHPLTLLFAVGGAGAQKEIGISLLNSLAPKIRENKIRLVLAAGLRPEIREYFLRSVRGLGLEEKVVVLWAVNLTDYFSIFNQALRTTDILWTKPSELSFYSALGLPLVIAPTIGSHEEFNQRWLLKSGFGLRQKSPDLAAEWVFDLVEKGHLAEMAFEGFIEGEKLGAIKIQEIIEKCSGF